MVKCYQQDQYQSQPISQANLTSLPPNASCSLAVAVEERLIVVSCSLQCDSYLGYFACQLASTLCHLPK